MGVTLAVALTVLLTRYSAAGFGSLERVGAALANLVVAIPLLLAFAGPLLRSLPGGLRRTEQKKAFGIERVVEYLDHAPLQCGIQIDQQIAVLRAAGPPGAQSAAGRAPSLIRCRMSATDAPAVVQNRCACWRVVSFRTRAKTLRFISRDSHRAPRIRHGARDYAHRHLSCQQRRDHTRQVASPFAPRVCSAGAGNFPLLVADTRRGRASQRTAMAVVARLGAAASNSAIRVDRACRNAGGRPRHKQWRIPQAGARTTSIDRPSRESLAGRNSCAASTRAGTPLAATTWQSR